MTTFLFAAYLLVTLAGCGEPAIRTFPVSGKITLDEQPIVNGSITFEAADGGAGAFSGAIQNGEYKLHSTAGLKKVSIVSYRPRGDPNTPTPDMVNYIPPRYNIQTTLTAEVKPGEENRFDFPLKSK